jgi:hypothetical protein
MDLAKRGTNKQTSRGNRKPRELSDLHRDMNFMHRSQAILDGVFIEMKKKLSAWIFMLCNSTFSAGLGSSFFAGGSFFGGSGFGGSSFCKGQPGVHN